MPNLPTSSPFIPPLRHGVSASKVFVIKTEHGFETLLEFLCWHFPHIHENEWHQRFHDRLVYDLQGNILTINSPYIPQTHVYYYRFLTHEIHVPFQEKILYENEDLLVVDKPHFLTMSPTGQYVQETLLVRLKKQTNNQFLTPIHRLDRETAGVVLFSKRPETRGIYQQMFTNRKIEKIYNAIAPYQKTLELPTCVCLKMEKGHPFYTMQIVDGEPNSKTEIKLLEHNNNWAIYQLHPFTGKQHQLRVHLNYLGIPIKNDPFYPVIVHKKDDDFTQPLQLLAKELSFVDPILQCHFHFKSQQVLTL